MKRVIISDMTLRESDKISGVGLSFREKLELAKMLEKLGVDVIEIGYVGDSQTDIVTAGTIADTVTESVVCASVGLDRAAIERTAKAISAAARPRINLVAATSTAQMEYTYNLKSGAMLEKFSELAALCVSLCPDVEFTAKDATRSDQAFLDSMIKAALSAGVKTITLSDPASRLTPAETAGLVSGLRERVPEAADAVISLHLRDELALAVANAFAAVAAGAGQLKTTFNGFGEPCGNLSMELLAHAFSARSDLLAAELGLNLTNMTRSCKQMERILGHEQSGRSPLGTIAPSQKAASSSATLSPDSDLLAVRAKIISLGYELPESDVERIYDQFCTLAKKKTVYDRDIEAMIAESAMKVIPTYKLISYVINSGNTITATALINIEKDGELIQGISVGDGPIDASFHTIEQLVGRHFELEDFQIRAVTEGREAMGDALVKLRHNGKLYSGRGLSTDIIGSSIRAYVNALNKIAYEEKQSI